MPSIRALHLDYILFSPLPAVTFLFIVFFSVLALPQSVHAVDVTLTWDSNQEDDLAGYRIYHREEGQNYNYESPSWEGTETSCTLIGLNDSTTHYFVARAFDMAGNESVDSDQEFYIPNQAPVLDPIGAKAVDEGQILEFTVTASDPDDDSLAFSAGNVPTGANFDPGTQVFTWSPDYGDAGNYGVIFSVTDNGTPIKSDSEEITITVGNVNRPPVLNPIGAKAVDEGQILEFTLAASDPDNDELAFSAENLPAGANFDIVSKTFTWSPDYGDAGNYGVIFTVTDNGSPLQSDTEEVTITVGNVNRPPVLNPIGAKTVGEGQTLQFVVTGTDPDNDQLTYTAGDLPLNASFDAAAQTFTWSPDYGDAGDYAVTFTLTDNGSPSLSDTEEVTITVAPDNQPPAAPQGLGISVVQ
jgi:hypothetical protein